MPLGDGWSRIIAWDRRHEDVPLDVPLGTADVRDSLKRIAGTDFGMEEPRWRTRFLSERRQAERYRVGRVFLAGDAAHVHSPLGGQGMNTGIQDAVNLGWKLAAAVQGWAPQWLLDTYEAERHPVGARVLQVTDRFNQLVVGGSELRRWLWTLAIWGLIQLRPARHKLQDRLTGIGITYPRVDRRGSRWEGRRIPDLCVGKGRLYEQMRYGKFLLVDMSTGSAAVTEAESWAHRVRTVQADPQRGLPAIMLIRPDGYVAWAGDEPAQAAAALTEWCGQPTSLPTQQPTSPLAASA